MKGKFFNAISRTEEEVSKERAEGIAEETELVFRRQVEDTELELKQLERQKKETLNVINLDNFKSNKFVDDQLSLAIKINNVKKRLVIIKEQYAEMFE